MTDLRIPHKYAQPGDKYNLLVVVEQAGLGKYKGKWEPAYILQCACGNLVKVTHNRLKEIKSCGCMLGWKLKSGDASRLGWGESYLNRIVRGYKQNAKSRGLEFCLTAEQVKDFITTNCTYCKRLPSDVHEATGNTKDRHYGRFKHNGIDRKDSGVGYIVENCVTACKTCNWMKSDMQTEDFIAHVKDIAKNYKAD